MTKIYLAAASQEIETARGYMRRLQEAGFEIARNWVALIDSHGGVANPMGDKEEARKLAFADMTAVAGCDVFWLLDPGQGVQTVGAWVELGGALMSDATIYISSPYALTGSIFMLTAAQNFRSHEDAFEHIVATWDTRAKPGGCPPHAFCLDPNSHTGQSCTRCNATG